MRRIAQKTGQKTVQPVQLPKAVIEAEKAIMQEQILQAKMHQERTDLRTSTTDIKKRNRTIWE